MATAFFNYRGSFLNDAGLPARRGVSLIELLVVITIMLIITAAAIPTIAPAVANRRVREAARMTSSFISGARARAIESGRPVGVQLEGLGGEESTAIAMYYVESPAPYSGDTTASKLVVNAGTINTDPASDMANLSRLVRVGDFVRLNFQGHVWRILQINGPTWTVFSETAPAQYQSALPTTTGTPYQIFRQPIRSSSAPLQLPESMAIDINASGVGTDVFAPEVLPPDPTKPIRGAPVVITFAPNGSVMSVTYKGDPNPPHRPTSPIYLLVGQRSKLPRIPYDNGLNAADSAKKHNFRDLQNLWVSINPATGLVTTSPVAVVSNPAAVTNNDRFKIDVVASRSLALDAQTLGGN